jgi:hypothetical protein
MFQQILIYLNILFTFTGLQFQVYPKKVENAE